MRIKLLCVDVVHRDMLFILLGFSRDGFEKIKVKLATLTSTYFHAHRVSIQLLHCIRKIRCNT